MATICIRCGQPERSFGQCDSCNPPKTPIEPILDSGIVEDEQIHWQNWAVSRVVVGLMVALGLEYAFGQYTRTLFGDSFEPWMANDIRDATTALTINQVLWGLAILFGTTLIGAAHRQSWILGATAGMLNGAVLIVWEEYLQIHSPGWVVWTRPLIHALLGAIGGYLGGRIWKPIPLVGTRTQTRATGNIPKASWNFLAGPVYLGRVFAGVFIVVSGVVWSNAIFEYLIREGRGNMPLASHFQSELVVWEISVLATILGAGFAGANTYNGLKHGMCVAAGATCIFLGIQLNQPRTNIDHILLNLGSIIFFSMLGGWFGSKLAPPVVAARRRRSIYDD